MIRLLALVAFASFVLSAVSLTAALAITGPQAVFEEGAWTWGPGGWGRGAAPRTVSLRGTAAPTATL